VPREAGCEGKSHHHIFKAGCKVCEGYREDANKGLLCICKADAKEKGVVKPAPKMAACNDNSGSDKSSNDEVATHTQQKGTKEKVPSSLRNQAPRCMCALWPRTRRSRWHLSVQASTSASTWCLSLSHTKNGQQSKYQHAGQAMGTRAEGL
jgi:hypothetical protein